MGALMVRNVTRIEWTGYTEDIPAFLTMIGIPLAHLRGPGHIARRQVPGLSTPLAPAAVGP